MSHAGVALVDPQAIFIKAGISPGMHVADFGCGRTGHFIFSLSRLVGENGIVYAVDILKEVLEYIRGRIRAEGYDNIHTIWSDIELSGKTAIPEGTLDGVFFVNVLSRITGQKETLAEAARLIKPGGFVVVVEWTRNLGAVGPTPDRLVLPETLSGLVPGALTVTGQEPAGDYHYYAILRKG